MNIAFLPRVLSRLVLGMPLAATLFLAAPTFSAPPDMNGYWALHIDNGSLLLLELKQSGETVGGNVAGQRRPLTGTLQGEALHLSGTFTFSGAIHDIAFDGTWKGNKFTLKGVQQSAHEPIAATLNPVAREVVYPARLPLPALHDVPDNGLARTPPMGWNSWYQYRNSIDEATVRAVADAMAPSGMAKAGYNYIVIDAGWSNADSRDAHGHITGNEKFPDMKALADYIHSKGLKFGVYSSPGPQACSGYQGSYGHEEDDAMTLARWGVDFLKYDWCGASRIYQPTQADLQGAYQKMGDALHKTGRPVVYSLCEYGMGDVWTWGSKVGGNMWRTTGDIHDGWAQVERIGFAQLHIASFNHPGGWNDPDMLQTGLGGMMADEYRTQMSLWCLLAAPLFASNDLRTMSEETKSILENSEVIAIDQDPAALPLRRLEPQGDTEVLIRPLADDAVAVGLFNRGSEPAQISVRWDSLNLHEVLGGKTLQARDLWKHEAVPVTGSRYAATVPAHGTVMLKVSAIGR